MQIMERPGNNHTTIKLDVDFQEFNLPSNENILENEETCEQMEVKGGFTRIRSKPRCQMDLNDLISKEKTNKVALNFILRKL